MFGKRNCQTDKSLRQQDYRTYSLSKKEAAQYGGIGFFFGSFLLYFFYRTGYVAVMGVPCAVLYCGWKRRKLCETRKYALEQQFKDWISGTASSLQAGYSVENAFIKAGRELKLLYGEETDIRREIRNMEHLLANNVTLEAILSDLGMRSGAEDVQNFADVFAVGKRSGGNLHEMIMDCCEIIMMKADVEREVQTLIHGKVTEQRIMCLVPFGIIFYISVTSPGYFAPLYHNPAGVCIMTACLIVYGVSVALSLRIVRIKV